MRELKIGEQEIRVRATPLALLYYRQEFKADLVGDMLKMTALRDDPTNVDSVVFLQIIWAMAKADAGMTQQYPSFIEWVASLDEFDLSDPQLLTAAMEEAKFGFFRGGPKPIAPKKK